MYMYFCIYTDIDENSTVLNGRCTKKPNVLFLFLINHSPNISLTLNSHPFFLRPHPRLTSLWCHSLTRDYELLFSFYIFILN